MTWGYVAVAAVSAVAGGISASQKNKQARKAGQGLDGSIAYARKNPGIFGEKIDFEELSYDPLFKKDPGYGGLAGDVIAGNRRNLPASLALASDTNEGITQGNLDRIRKLYPGIDAAFEQQSSNTQNLLRGEIPYEDQNLLTSRRTEAQSLGGTGVNRQQVAADLGMTRLSLMNQGANSMAGNVNLWDAIDPVSRQVLPQSLFVDVGQAMDSAVRENQFDASFQQAERNAEFAHAMTPDPQKTGLLNLEAARAGLKAGNPQTSVIGAAATAGLNSYAGSGGAYAGGQAAGQYFGGGARAGYAQPVDTSPTTRQGPAYASVQDQALGYQTLSGNGYNPQAQGYGTYNPGTTGQYGQQGGLWSYFNTPQR